MIKRIPLGLLVLVVAWAAVFLMAAAPDNQDERQGFAPSPGLEQPPVAGAQSPAWPPWPPAPALQSFPLNAGKLVGSEIVDFTGLPPELKPTQLVAADETVLDSGKRVRRRVVATDSALGRILVVESADHEHFTAPLFYSADHLVAAAADRQGLEGIRISLAAAQLAAAEPFPEAGFLYVSTASDTPAGIYERLRIATEIVAGAGEVELDGMGSAGGAPTDPSYNQQWHHQSIDSEAAWDTTRGRASIVVAVLDTGINTSLSEFSGRLVAGYDYANDDSEPTDDHGHGTAVAGTVAANANNDVLVAGMDWNCKLMPLKVLDSSNWGYYSWWAAGVNFARNNGARVINLSAGGTGGSSSLTYAINNAIADGLVFVTISQNNGEGTVRYPGNLSQSITVGATERNDTLTDFSNWGPQVDMVAPGRDIYTVSRSGSLTWWWGTSFAAPQVAGAAALLLSVNPSLDQDAVSTLLTAGAEDQVGDSRDTPGFDDYYGWGRLNVHNSLTLALPSVVITSVDELGARLRWQAPPNAATKHPFGIRWSADGVHWNTIDSPSISYGVQATWTDDGSETGLHPEGAPRRLYQIHVGN